MSIVIDASVVVDLLAGPAPEVLLASVIDEEWHAPQHVDAEVVHALRGLVLGGHLSQHRARDALSDLHDLQLHRWPFDLPLALRALDLAHNVTAYDAAYLALAEALGVPLITRDRRLARAAASLSVEVEVV